VRATIISNSAIYGIIRQRARGIIEKALKEDGALGGLVASARDAKTGERSTAARKALSAHLTRVEKWNERDAALMVEYAGLDFGKTKAYPRDRSWVWSSDKEVRELTNTNLGPLGAIGEQKATQFFARLASRFDPESASAYESIFTAWGGDVRERSVDLGTGKVRPRELTVDPELVSGHGIHRVARRDPTIYARVDYLDPNAKISEAEKASCRTILKNLPVIFTFAPMNILHYRVKFPAGSKETLTVSYSQYAYSDTRSPASYQLAYVVHPASLWDSFGPINLAVMVPKGVKFRASVPCKSVVAPQKTVVAGSPDKAIFDFYRGRIEKKTGEIYVAVGKESWQKTGRPAAAGKSSSTGTPVVQKTSRRKKGG
jgi:hypothetical protein